jgi:hypothetical protein
LIKANYRDNDPNHEGYRSSDRLKLVFKNLKIWMRPEDLKYGPQEVHDVTPLLAASTEATNEVCTSSLLNWNVLSGLLLLICHCSNLTSFNHSK